MKASELYEKLNNWREVRAWGLHDPGSGKTIPLDWIEEYHIRPNEEADEWDIEMTISFRRPIFFGDHTEYEIEKVKMRLWSEEIDLVPLDVLDRFCNGEAQEIAEPYIKLLESLGWNYARVADGDIQMPGLKYLVACHPEGEDMWLCVPFWPYPNKKVSQNRLFAGLCDAITKGEQNARKALTGHNEELNVWRELAHALTNL